MDVMVLITINWLLQVVEKVSIKAENSEKKAGESREEPGQ